MPELFKTIEHFMPPLSATIFRIISAPQIITPSTLRPVATPPGRHPCHTPPINRTKATASDHCASTPRFTRLINALISRQRYRLRFLLTPINSDPLPSRRPIRKAPRKEFGKNCQGRVASGRSRLRPQGRHSSPPNPASQVDVKNYPLTPLGTPANFSR